MARDIRLQLTGLWRVRFTRFLKTPLVEVEVMVPANIAADEHFTRYFWEQATPEDLEKIGFPDRVNIRRATFAGVKVCNKFRPASKRQTN